MDDGYDSCIFSLQHFMKYIQEYSNGPGPDLRESTE